MNAASAGLGVPSAYSRPEWLGHGLGLPARSCHCSWTIDRRPSSARRADSSRAVAAISAAWHGAVVVQALAPPVAKPYSVIRSATPASCLAAAICRVRRMCATTVATLTAYGWIASVSKNSAAPRS